MSPETASLIGSLGGSLINSASGLFGANQQENFQENFYKNRYQWQVEDMKKAGLNPALSYSNGAPSGGSGASYDVGSDLAGGFSKIMQAKLGEQQINTAKNQAALLESQKANTDANTQTTNAVRGALVNKALADANNSSLNNAMSLYMLPYNMEKMKQEAFQAQMQGMFGSGASSAKTAGQFLMKSFPSIGRFFGGAENAIGILPSPYAFPSDFLWKPYEY